MRALRAFFGVVVAAGEAWSLDKVSLFAAAIAYYTIFSLTPLLALTVALAGIVFGPSAVEGEIVSQIEQIVGPEAAVLVENLLESALQGASEATIISIVIVLFGASGVFNQTKRALDVIFGVIPRADNGVQGVFGYIKTRSLSFLMVFVMGLLLLSFLALNTLFSVFSEFVIKEFPAIGQTLPSVNTLVSPVILFVFFSLIFKTLPDIEIAWRDVWLGAAVTTGLFLLGGYVISFYLRLNVVASVYGAASSLIVILVWIYYSAQIVLYGAEFTKVYARRLGRGIRPSESAQFIAERYLEETPELEMVRRLPEPVPDLEVIFEETAEPTEPRPQRRQTIAAGLIGLATGLFLGFLASLRGDD